MSLERGANAVGMSIPPLATTESERSSRSQPYKALFLMGGYNAAKGLISRDISKRILYNLVIFFILYQSHFIWNHKETKILIRTIISFVYQKALIRTFYTSFMTMKLPLWIHNTRTQIRFKDSGIQK